MPTVERLGPLYSQPSPAGLVRLQSHLLATFPTARAGGMYNPTSSLSGGGPSPHRVTQALDVMCDRATAARIIRYLVTIAEALNLQQVIAWHEIVTVQRWSAGIRPYAPSDHSDGNGHAHIHVGLAASRYFDVSWIGGAKPVTPAPPPPPPPEPPPTKGHEMDSAKYLGHEHVYWIDADGALREYVEGVGWRTSRKLSGPNPPPNAPAPLETFLPQRGVRVVVEDVPGGGEALHVYAVARDGALITFSALGNSPLVAKRIDN